MDQVSLAQNQIRVDRWRMLIQTCQQSGQTVVNWCEENDINIKTYYYWLRSEAELKPITWQQFRWLMEGLQVEQKQSIRPTEKDDLLW